MSYVSNEVELTKDEVETVNSLYEGSKQVIRKLWCINKEEYLKTLVDNKFLLDKADMPEELHDKLNIVQNKVMLLFNDIFSLKSAVLEYESEDLEEKIAVEKDFEITVEYTGTFYTSIQAKSEEEAIEKFNENHSAYDFTDEIIDNATFDDVSADAS